MEVKGLFLLSAVLLPALTEAVYNYDYMFTDTNNCTSTQILDLSTKPSTYGFVRPVQYGGYPSNVNCRLNIIAPRGQYLVVRFHKIEIYQPEKKICGTDYLLLSGNTSTYTYCGYGTPSYALISTTDTIRLNFVANNTLDSNSRIGFDLYYTSFHRGSCNTSGDHPSEFQCRRDNRCIPRELTCDRLDNCGDWTDERSAVCGLSTAMTVIVTLIVLLVLCTCVTTAIMIACSKSKKRVAQETHMVTYAPGEDLPPPYSVAVVTDMTMEKQPLPPDYVPSPAYDVPSPAYDVPSLQTHVPSNQVVPSQEASQ